MISKQWFPVLVLCKGLLKMLCCKLLLQFHAQAVLLSILRVRPSSQAITTRCPEHQKLHTRTPASSRQQPAPPSRCCTQLLAPAWPLAPASVLLQGFAACCSQPGGFQHLSVLKDGVPAGELGVAGVNLRACYRRFLSFSLCLCFISRPLEQMLPSNPKSIQ